MIRAILPGATGTLAMIIPSLGNRDYGRHKNEKPTRFRIGL